jgi:alpha 1,2-mannosyltransferase
MFMRVSGLTFRVFTVALAISTFLGFTYKRQMLLDKHVGETFDTLQSVYDEYAVPKLDSLQRIYDDHAPKISLLYDQHNEDLSLQLVTFSKELQNVLRKVRPHAPPISPKEKAKEQRFNSSHVTWTKEEFIDISKTDLEDLKDSHRNMMQHIPTLGSKLPYHRGSRGVVMTAGGGYIGILLVSLRMLRRSGSQLPVEVFLDRWEDDDLRMCEEILPSLNAKCRVLSEIWATTHSLEKLKSYQHKIFAILFSSFQDVLFLDADAFPAYSPDDLLLSEPFESTGLVTWPDFWFLSSSSHFYDIAGIEAPSFRTRAATESGIILVSKNKHVRTLLLAAYYNYYGPNIYYPLLSQGAPGEGDKETFLHAAMASNSPFYAVSSPVKVMGKWLDGTWHSAGMKQADPFQDVEIYTSSHEANANETTKNPRPFFIHNNILKLDPKHIFDDRFNWNSGEAKFNRLWGDKEDLVKDFGRDIEKEMWEELAACSCSIGDSDCAKVRDHYRNVYVKVQSY